MKIDEFNSLVEDLTKDRKGVAEGKREDYTKGDSDVLKNFKNQAEALGVTPEVSLAVHMEKQFSAVLNYIKTEGESESEPIIKRIGDTINYLELLWGLINEDKKESNKEVKGFYSHFNKYPLSKNPVLRFMGMEKFFSPADLTLFSESGGTVIVTHGTLLKPYYE